MSEKKCSCHAYMAGECVCGAWDDNDLLAANKEIEQLKQAIRTTLDNNRHLADGEDCTLIELKRAMKGEWQ